MRIITFPLWKRVRLQIIVCMFLTGIILASWGYFYITFSQTYQEANQTWKSHIERIEIKSVGDSVSEVAPQKTESTKQPEAAEADQITSAPPSEIEKLIRKIWNNEEEAKIAIAVAKSESHLNPKSIGDQHLKFYKDGKEYGASYGVFQIRHLEGRPDPSQLLDPEFNVKYAYELYQKSGFYPWSQFKNGNYKKYIASI
ncbi:MAG: hypothetical protein QMD77_00100 [Patescibacteria group bacterium]|nr:hypothetical protein [Patescibacteria group bacterium]